MGGLDEAHMGDAVGEAGITWACWRVAAHRPGEVAIDVGEGLEIALRMAGRQPRRGHRLAREVGPVAARGPDFLGPAAPGEAEVIGMLLLPVQPRFLAPDR